ncbi:hypothetical protein D0Z07_4043 [Hyphodiscus hymeniophilus]|uniref:F-box domain-containing protein n=1 Tax=Hyphodiscus hymeniophilus TaxID=353542 RepID=A0A9P6VL82_9HELO|nr:hypothetical protein D0Z07_4043 [Hyphodiscus hymeniophilus]
MSGYGYRLRRDFLSPLNALDSVQEDASMLNNESARLPNTPESISQTPSTLERSTISRDLLSADALEQQSGDWGLHTQVKKVRRFSDQDLKTRSARASVVTIQSHRSTTSYPFYSPSQASNLSYLSSPRFLPSGIRAGMDPPRLQARPVSSTSSRSSFDSRHRSPLSISSSMNYESSRSSVDSSYSANAKLEFLATQAPAYQESPENGRRPFVESIAPAYSRYGAGARGRHQSQTTLITPQRISRGPTSPTSPTSFGMKFTPRTPGEMFKKLPQEILLVILGELKKSHLEVGSLSCSTCWMRDVTNLGISCRKWWGAARIALYEDIQLNGTDSAQHMKKKFKVKYGTRLKLLRRTLTTRPDVAQLVKCLKVPAMPNGMKTKKEQEEYVDLAASLIMACPNLEQFPSFYPAYDHEFSRIVHALSTRNKLTERVWIINPSPFQRQRRYAFDKDSDSLTPILAPGLLLPEQCIEILNYHMRWPNLKTLFLHCNPGGTIDSLLFTDIFNSLPALEHLHVSSFPAPSFNDSTLTSLPPLRSLRLDNLPGITATGLSHYAAATCSDVLTHLSLISVPLLSLPVLARLFSHLVSLTHFTISQAASPALPIGVDIFLHPYLASRTLQHLHWEFTNPDDDNATDILGKSIAFNGFPALRNIRAPTDFDGTLQKLCKPRYKIELPGDRYRNMGPASSYNGLPHSQSFPSMPPSPARSAFSLGHGPQGSISSSFVKSPTRSTFSLTMDHSHSHNLYDDDETRSASMSLVTARRMAQNRIDTACKQPEFDIIVWDDCGKPAERFAVGGFIGDINSKIFYNLTPDIDGMDESVVTIDGIGGLLDAGEEMNPRDGCTGSWNLRMATQGKNGRTGGGKEKWWHTERGRWREVPLGKFF